MYSPISYFEYHRGEPAEDRSKTPNAEWMISIRSPKSAGFGVEIRNKGEFKKMADRDYDRDWRSEYDRETDLEYERNRNWRMGEPYSRNPD